MKVQSSQGLSINMLAHGNLCEAIKALFQNYMMIPTYTPLFKFFKSFLAFDLLLFFWGSSTAFSCLARSQTHMGSRMNPVILTSRILSLKSQIPFVSVTVSSSFQYTNLLSPAEHTHRNNHAPNAAHTPAAWLLCVCCGTLNLNVFNLCFLYTMVIGNGLQQHLKNTIILYNDIWELARHHITLFNHK